MSFTRTLCASLLLASLLGCDGQGSPAGDSQSPGDVGADTASGGGACDVLDQLGCDGQVGSQEDSQSPGDVGEEDDGSADAVASVDAGDGTDPTGSDGQGVPGEDSLSPADVQEDVIVSAGPVSIVDTCEVVRDPDGSLHETDWEVPWATLGGEPLMMSIAHPTAAGLHPLVVFVHGGGWSDGGRYWYDGTIETVAANGFVAASVDYRLAGEAGNRFPTAVQDVRCAIRWLRANASTYGIDPARVAVVGGSAGAQISALIGLAPEVEAFDGECPVQGQSAAVSAVAGFYGPFDLRASSFGGDESGMWDVETLLGGLAADLPELAAQASPLLYVDASDPPVLLSHGDADTVVPLAQSQGLLEALQAAGVPSALVTVPGGEHGYVPDAEGAQHLQSTCTFMQFLRDTIGD